MKKIQPRRQPRMNLTPASQANNIAWRFRLYPSKLCLDQTSLTIQGQQCRQRSLQAPKLLLASPRPCSRTLRDPKSSLALDWNKETMPPSLPQFSAARMRSYIFRLPLFTRCILAIIVLLWLVSLQSAWDVQKAWALIPSEIGIATSSSTSSSYSASIAQTCKWNWANW